MCSWNIKILVPIALPGLCSLHYFKSINCFEKPEYPFLSLQFPRHFSQSLLYLFFHWLLQFLKCAFLAQFPTTCGSPFWVRMLSVSLSSVRILQSLSHTCMQTLLLISISLYYALYLFQRNFSNHRKVSSYCLYHQNIWNYTVFLPDHWEVTLYSYKEHTYL